MWYAEEFVSALRSQGLSERTVRNYRLFIRRLVDYCLGNGIDDCRQVSEDDVELYLTLLHESSDTQGWKYTHSLSIRRYFQFLADENIIFAPPRIRCKHPRLRSNSFPAVEENELRHILDQFPAESDSDVLAKTILETAYSSALRSSEIRALKLQDISFSSGTLFLEQAKGEKDRIVPVGKTSMKWLSRYITDVRGRYLGDPEDPHVFIGIRTGRAFRHRALAEFVKARLRRHGLQHLNIHQLRASAATHMVSAGMNVAYAQHILGHQELATTQSYIQIRQDELKHILAEAHPRAAMEKYISAQGEKTT